jgi:hypothetical protein
MQMPGRIERNNLPDEVRDAVNASLLAAIGDREGDWTVSVDQRSQPDLWEVRIHGPNAFEWTRRFAGPQRSAAFLGKSARLAVSVAAGDLSAALSELIQQGVPFTERERPGGDREYVIDRVAFTEAEVVLLARQGALSREGIRSYLVNR